MASPFDLVHRLPGVAAPSAPDIATMAARQVRARGQSPFLTYYDGATGERTELSFATFGNWVSKTANLLVEELAVGPGDRVATVLGNHWTAPVVSFACWTVGASVVPLAGQAVGPDVIAACGATTAFVREDLVSAMHAGGDDAGIHQLVAVGVGMAARLTGPSDLPPGVLPYAEEVLGFPDDYDGGGASPDDDAVLARPAAGRPLAPVRLTQRNLIAAADAVTAWGLRNEDRVLCVRPAHLPDALILGLLGAFAAGAAVVLTRDFEPDRLWRRAADERVTLLLLAPGQLDDLPDGAPPPGLDCVMVPSSASDDAPRQTRGELPLAVGHGLAEATFMSSLSPRALDQPTRAWLDAAGGRYVGAVTTQAAVVALDPGGAPVEPGARGRLAVRGPVVMAGYEGRADLDAQAFAGGWLDTGERGHTALGPDGATHVFTTGEPD